MLRSAVCKITNCSLPDNKWIQSGLRIRDGGLGIRRVSSLALPTFLASAADSLPLQGIILSNVTLQPDSFISSYIPRWSAMFGSPPINQPPFQANSHFGTDQEFWPTKPWSKPPCQMSMRRPLFSQHQLLTVEIGFWLCLSLPVDSV